jgi:K+-transporting ATPase ATPase B chain
LAVELKPDLSSRNKIMKTLDAELFFPETPSPSPVMSPPPRRTRRIALFAPELIGPALRQAFVMLRPDIQWANPVMFVVEVGAFLTLMFAIGAAIGYSTSQVSIGYFIELDVWLFLTVLFANFATALAEARGKAQAESLRKTRFDTPAYRLRGKEVEEVFSTSLRPGDLVVVEAGQVIPGDGEVVEGIASVDEAAITRVGACYPGVRR